MNNILYFASKHLKRTFEKKSLEVGSIKYGPGTKYLLNTVQYVQHFASKYLKYTLKKSHMKSVPSYILLRCTIYLTRSNK